MAADKNNEKGLLAQQLDAHHYLKLSHHEDRMHFAKQGLRSSAVCALNFYVGRVRTKFDSNKNLEYISI